MEAKIFPEDLQEFVNWDTSIVWDRFPQTTDVLTLHGLADKTVPPYVFLVHDFLIISILINSASVVSHVCSYDALIYASALSARKPGTHTLHLMEDADHNFTGRQDDVVEAILQWWDVRLRGEIGTGIWVGGIKGKLWLITKCMSIISIYFPVSALLFMII